MRMEKKRILKEDGRYLTYYHFPDSATPEQSAAFADVTPMDPTSESATPTPGTAAKQTQPEGNAHV